jgi:hypothetical protein
LKGSKRFFFEKKKQKTFSDSGPGAFEQPSRTNTAWQFPLTGYDGNHRPPHLVMPAKAGIHDVPLA